jgi:hypothetical protein
MVTAGLAACAVALFAEQLGLGSGGAARGTFGWQQILLLVAGAVVGASGALLLAFPRAVAHRLGPERIDRFAGSLLSPSDRVLRYLAIGLLALLGLVLTWTRLIHIDQSLWHDEVYTVANFSGVGPRAILLWDSGFNTNNHVAYNFLSWLTASLLGESEPIYRFWSVVPAIVAIGVVAWWTWRRLGRVAAVAFATIAVASPIHLEYATQARGYGLALLAASLLLVAADRLTRSYSRLTLAGFVGAGLLGIWTLFTFAVPFVGQALALLRWRRLRLPVVIAVGVAGILSVVFYAPVLGDVAGSGASGEKIPLVAALLLDRPLEWMVIPTVTLLTGDGGRASLNATGVTPDTGWGNWLDVAVLAAYVLGLIALWRRGNGGLALILLLPPLVFNLFLSLDQQTTVVRHQFFLLPYIILPVAVAIAEVGRLAARSQFLRPLAIAAGVVLLLALAVAIVNEEEGREVPYENFKEVAAIVRGTGIDTVVTDSNRPDGLRYYIGDELLEMPAEGVEALLCGRRREFVYVRHIPSPQESWEGWRPARLDCLVGREATRVRVPQRGRGGAIDVWVVGQKTSTAAIDDDLPYAPKP